MKGVKCCNCGKAAKTVVQHKYSIRHDAFCTRCLKLFRKQTTLPAEDYAELDLRCEIPEEMIDELVERYRYICPHQLLKS